MDPFAIKYQAQVSSTATRRIRRGHLWVYATEVEREPADENPAIVQVTDPARNHLGYAFYSRRSQIRLRLFSRDSASPSADTFRSLITKSIERRRPLLGGASACRLVFGESDFLPGIIVDRFADYIVLQTLSAGADALKPLIVEIVKNAIGPKGILERNDVRVRLLEGLEEVRGVLWGTVPDHVEMDEDGIRFTVDLVQGQKTGFFLDQRENRVASRKYASGKALDCFTNTGAFALNFAPYCDSVLAVDISADSLATARRNCELNGFKNVSFKEANAFDFLREMETQGQVFDTVCLDPPAFAKNRKSLQGARSGYKEINLRAMKLLKPDGILITSSCSYHMPEPDFYDLLCEAARDCHRYIQVLERRSQAGDHPMLAGMPETYYLKCFFLRIL